MRLNFQGMTLIEVTMACLVVAVLAGMLALLLNKTIFVNRYAIEQGLNTYSIDSSLRNFARFLREARQSDAGDYLLQTADPFEIVFFSNIDNDPAIERVRIFLDGTQLKMSLAEATGFPVVYPEEDEETKIIGNGIVNTPEQPLFYYYNHDYPVDQINNPLQGNFSPQTVSLVKIDVYANIEPGHTPENIRMQTFVRPRNINYY